MKRDMMVYVLGNLVHATDLSTQCQTVRRIMLAEGDDQDRISQLLKLLDGSAPLEDDTVTLLVRGIRGHYGLEGYILDISSQEEAEFWNTLRHRFQFNADICLIAADALFLAAGPTEEALDMFFAVFDMNPTQRGTTGADVSDAMLASKTHRLRYQLQELKWAIADGDTIDINYLVEELRIEYGDNLQVLNEVNRLVRTVSGD